MAAIRLKASGDFTKTFSFLKRAQNADIKGILGKYGEEGVRALAEVTPRETGKTADSWYYETTASKYGCSLSFWNRNVNKGVPIAIVLYYGHGTGTGGWVEGRDYINPVIGPIFDRIAEELWKEVTDE